MKFLYKLGLLLFLSTNCQAQVGIDSSTIKKDSFNEDNIIFTKVENEANFPGGDAAWRKYLVLNLDASTPAKNKAPDGIYQVIIRFVVKKDGSIDNVIAETNFGYGMEGEAIRIIKNGPKWVPAVQNGRAVNCYRRQPITFVVQGS